ncbi:zinc finger protein PLAG1 isoform X1 [Triplophysa rosa]|uniref:Zinc finger protein PLAG1 n=1 Tax=Triplophysa rosa TaxID=992332 RepID=A0A9W7X5V4_TRIRA|nr:zinc finger protein PLAG1 isoform X1 [Triplophysa rosa]XP_057196884.1 zinc finger protein PLAG1 isoform X1 [Triplophysa rosa]KAI7814568.1 zinc finger protein PLAG1 [Triplophysa rosa]
MATVAPNDCPTVAERCRSRKRRVEGKVRKNFSCQLCEKSFNSLEKLKVHSYSHTGERPYRCTHNDCNKAFVSKYKLLRHMATHSPEKTHKCSYCEKMFHRKDHLKNHLHTHDPNKEAFSCTECGKSYNTKLGFRRHQALHAAHRGDLTCQVCLQPYPSTPLLLEHLRGHAGKSAAATKEKRHQCEHCERRFYTRKDVRRHLVVHTGRKDFLCQYCAQRFGRKDHLTRHVKKSHAHDLLRVKAEPVDLMEPRSSPTSGSLALRYPLGHASYSPPPLRGDLESYLLELQAEEAPKPNAAAMATGDAVSSLDFLSPLFNFLPYNQGAVPALGVPYSQEEGLPSTMPMQDTPESLSLLHTLTSHTLSQTSTLTPNYTHPPSLNTTTTLPRFHQAFQ